MDSITAFAMGQANRGREPMVFDWDLAARLIRERNATHARAGLRSDWEWTGGDIPSDGKPVPREDTYTYLASTWATPELEIDGDLMDCYRLQSKAPTWDAHTYWPESAVAILRGAS